jgi:nitrogen-specific signal transduction histidine kinase
VKTIGLDKSASGTCLALASEKATYFAPAGRDAPNELLRKAAAVHGVPLLDGVLDAMPSMVMVLNSNRQIVAANETLLSMLQVSIGQVVEKRPGEAIGCIRANEGPDGCGTGRSCATCGAVNAILDSQKQDRKVVRECRVLVEGPSGISPMDLRVTASPLPVGDEQFIVAAVEDIGQAKRLAVLQRTFFHDVMNTAGCIHGYLQFLASRKSHADEVAGELLQLSSQLMEDIQAQRDLMYAESGELATQFVPVRTLDLLEDVRFQYARHMAAEGRTMVLGSVTDEVIVTDRRLILRVIGNMVKNALEATGAGRVVTLNCFDVGSEIAFAVNNPEAMPEDVQRQVFQRSFSTKEQFGRGIGTYSMKLFGERYLGGKVEFSSTPPKGTTFTLTVSKKPSPTS